MRCPAEASPIFYVDIDVDARRIKQLQNASAIYVCIQTESFAKSSIEAL